MGKRFAKWGMILSLLLAIGLAPLALAGQGGEAGMPGGVAERELVIYAAIERKLADELVADFNRLYPGTRVFVVIMEGGEVFSNYMADQARRRESADLLWSGEAALQAALVRDGYAQIYRSAESGSIFPWANYGDMAYATSHEPVAMVYNKRLLQDKELPTSHRALLKTVAEERFRGKIGTCDPEKNGRAFSLLAQDQTSGFNFWGMVQGFGAAELTLAGDYAALLDRVASGGIAFAYNVPAQEAFRRAKSDPNLGAFYAADYTLSQPHTILITRGAPHANAARLWIDYILSARGQALIAEGTGLFPVRGDVAGGWLAREPQKLPGGRGLKVMMPVREMTRYNEQGIRRGFLVRWQEMLKSGKNKKPPLK